MAYDGYVEIEGIKGESTDVGFTDQIEILDYCHLIKQGGGSQASSAGGLTGARIDVGDFTFMKVVDKSTPSLFVHCCRGKHIPKVTLRLCEATGVKHAFLTYEFTNVIISSVQCLTNSEASEMSEAGFSRPVEQISIRFGKIQLAYSHSDITGSVSGEYKQGWDLSKNNNF